MAHSIFKYVGNTHNSDGQETVNAQQHRLACDHRYTREPKYGRALRMLVQGWAEYAEAACDTFDQHVGDDGVLGPHWEAIGKSLQGLLDGPTGGWDCGSLSHNINETLEANGCEVRT